MELLMESMANIPTTDPHYKQKRAITKKALKKIVYSYCCGVNPQEKTTYNEEAIIPEYLSIWNVFKKNDFDFYSFMINEDYNLIEDDIVRDEILVYCFSFLNLPISRFMPDVANGYLEIKDIASTFFCSSELDIWRLIAEKKIMDVSLLYAWYKGQDLEPTLEIVTGISCQSEKDETKAEKFLTFLLDEKNNSTDCVRKEAIVLKHLSTQFTAND
jgi:hypothetical protein